ncbi:hypothetical protein [Desulfonatronum thioautotrophicum]|uniref:hypothetical protein n=1 Tax=Desulfonatronum thioautotrophicum TaxID=617001 RepID=UPI0005EB15B7|nr:hypothetical protein [Desulfonatronum thioautotrophicum]
MTVILVRSPPEVRYGHHLTGRDEWSVIAVETHTSPLKNSQLLRRCKNFKLSRMNKYASILNFFCSLHLGFLNGLPDKDFFNTQILSKASLEGRAHPEANRCRPQPSLSALGTGQKHNQDMLIPANPRNRISVERQ